MRILLFILIVSLPAAAYGAGVTKEQCEADYTAMVTAAEENRKKSLEHLEYQLRRTASDEQAERLRAEMEVSWDLEEEYRSFAANAYRDCLKAAQPPKP